MILVTLELDCVWQHLEDEDEEIKSMGMWRRMVKREKSES